MSKGVQEEERVTSAVRLVQRPTFSWQNLVLTPVASVRRAWDVSAGVLIDEHRQLAVRMDQTVGEIRSLWNDPGRLAVATTRGSFALLVGAVTNDVIGVYLGPTFVILFAPVVEELSCWFFSTDGAPYRAVRYVFGFIELVTSLPLFGIQRASPFVNMWLGSHPRTILEGVFEHFSWNLTCVLLQDVPFGGLLVLPGYYAVRRGLKVLGRLAKDYYFCNWGRSVDSTIDYLDEQPQHSYLLEHLALSTIAETPYDELDLPAGYAPSITREDYIRTRSEDSDDSSPSACSSCGWQEEEDEEVDMIFKPQMEETLSVEKIPAFQELGEETKEKFLAWFEYVALLIRDVQTAATCESLLRAMVHFVGHMTGKPVGVTLFNHLSKFWELGKVFLPQSDDGDSASMFERFLRLARTRLDDLRSFGRSKFSHHLQRLLVFLATFGFIEQTKFQFNVEKFKLMEYKTVELELGIGPSYLYNIADTMLWLAESGYQMFNGDYHGVLFSGTEYENMRKNYLRCKELFRDKAAFGVSKYLQLLRKTIDMGGAYARRDPIIDRWTVELIDILTSIKTKTKAGERRPLPWSTLLTGTPGIAKTRLAHLIFKLYSCIDEDVTYSDGSVYVRNPTAARFDGFQIGTPFCLFDDVGFLNPAGKIVDTQTTEIIQAINDVPWVPEQAALEDKGTVPFRCKAVLATSNVKDLNAHQYYKTPLAALRRFPIVMNVRLKPAVQNAEGVVRHDIVSATDDLWLITVERVHVNDPRHVYHTVEHNGVVLKDVDFKTVVPFLVEHIRAHLAAEVARNARDDVLASYTLCPHGVLSYQCDQCLTHDVEDTDDGLPLPPPNLPVVALQCAAINGDTHYATKDNVVIMLKRQVTPEFEEQGFDHIMVAPHLKGESWSFRIMVWTFVNVRQFFGYDVPEILVKLTTWTPRYFYLSMLGYVTRMKVVGMALPDAEQQLVWKRWAEAQRERYAPRPAALQWAATALAVLVPIWVMWKLYGLPQFEDQGAAASGPLVEKQEDQEVGPLKTPEGKGEDENPWLHAKPVSELPTTLARTVNFEEMLQKYTKNITTFIGSNGDYEYFVNGFPLGGTLYLVPLHFLVRFKKIHIRFREVCREVPVFEHSYVRLGEYDVAIFNAINTPPRYDFAKFLCDVFPRARATMVYHDKHGTVHRVKAHDLRLIENPIYEGKFKMPNGIVWGFDERPIRGTCGAPLFVEGPSGGVCIVGVHTGASEDRGLTIPLNPSFVQAYKDKLCPAFARPQGEVQISPEWQEVPLLPLHHKCPTNFMDAKDVMAFGSFGRVPTHKSRVGPTPGAKLLAERKICTDLVPPIAKGWFPWYDSLEKCQDKPEFDYDVLVESAQWYLKEILGSDIDFSEICKVTQDVAVNGVPGLKFVDAINRQTSTGWPYNKRKCDGFLHERPPDAIYQDAVDVDWRVQADIDRVWSALAEGNRSSPIFVGSLKDEPIKPEKAKRPRVFMGCPLGFAIVCRQLTVMFVRVFQNNPSVFEGSVGINAFSEDWAKLYDRLTQFGVDRIFAGDYEKFDKRQIAFLLLLAHWVVAEVCKASGNYTKVDYESIMAAGSDVAYAFVNYHGNLLMFLGTLPSGFILTVIINCIVNSIYMRYAWAKAGGDLSEFRSKVALTTYGDDNAANVSEDVDFFNHTTVQKTLGEAGIGYTMADKTSESVPFQNIGEIDFLKRGFRRVTVTHEGQTKVWTFAPLDLKSIDKMLTIWVRSKSVSAEKQYSDSVQSALYEAFQHGEEVFGKYRAHCKAVADGVGLWAYMPRNVLFDYDYFMDVIVFHVAKKEALSKFDKRHGCKAENEMEFVFDMGCAMQCAKIPKCIQQ